MDAKYAAAWQYVNLSIIQTANTSQKNKKKLQKVLDAVVDWCYNKGVETDKRDINTIKNECMVDVKQSAILGFFAWMLLKFIVEQIVLAILKRILNENKNT